MTRNRLRLTLVCRKFLDRASGNTINRGVREAGLSPGRVWTVMWLQWSPQRVLGELWRWTVPSQWSGIEVRGMSLCIPFTPITDQKLNVGCPQRRVLLKQGSFLKSKTVIAMNSRESTLQKTLGNQCHHHAGG